VTDIFKKMMESGEFYTYFSGRPSAETLSSLGFSFSHASSPRSLSVHVLEIFNTLPSSSKKLAERILDN
jgi:hypothetical protein